MFALYNKERTNIAFMLTKSVQYINVGIFAHIDAGKTTLVERLLYETGGLSYPGRIEDGTTESDTLPEEIKRGISIQSSVLEIHPFFHGTEYKIQILDTPGHIDFYTQVDNVLEIVDMAILLIDCSTGVKSQTELIYQKIKQFHIPFVIFLNKIDVFSEPESVFDGIIPYFSENLTKAFYYSEDGWINILSENLPPESITLPLVEWSEELASEILSHPEDSHQIAIRGLFTGFKESKLVPVFAGSALEGYGLEELLFFICRAELPQTKYPSHILGKVFKRKMDENYGRIIFFKAIDRIALPGEAYIFQKKVELEQCFSTNGELLSQIEPGQIVFSGNIPVEVGDVLSKEPFFLEEYPIHGQFSILIEPFSSIDREKILFGIDRLIWEDSGLDYRILDNGQFELRGRGELHLEVSIARLEEFIGRKFSLGKLNVAKNELLKNMARTNIFFEHSVFSGREKSGKIEGYIEKILDLKRGVFFHVNLDKNIQASIESGFHEVLSYGNFGHSVVGVNLHILSYKKPEGFGEHTLPLIKVAVISGIKKFIKDITLKIGPLTLFEILAPEEFLGQVIAGVQMRAAKIKEVETIEKVSCIKGEAATESLIGFTGILRNITKGKGTISMVTLFDSKNFSYVTN